MKFEFKENYCKIITLLIIWYKKVLSDNHLMIRQKSRKQPRDCKLEKIKNHLRLEIFRILV